LNASVENAVIDRDEEMNEVHIAEAKVETEVTDLIRKQRTKQSRWLIVDATQFDKCKFVAINANGSTSSCNHCGAILKRTGKGNELKYVIV